MGESIEGIAIFITDEEPIGSCIVYANEAFCAMSGFRPEQLIGHSALLLAGSHPDPVALTTAVVAPKSHPYQARERKTRPDGSTYLVDIRLEVLGEDRLVLTQKLVASDRIEDSVTKMRSPVLSQTSGKAAELRGPRMSWVPQFGSRGTDSGR